MSFFYHTLITLKRVFLSFIIAMFIGTCFGIYMGRNERLNSFLDDWLIMGLKCSSSCYYYFMLCLVWS